MSHDGAHENRRISIETDRSSRSDESTRTGFSYEDSAGSLGLFTEPSVHFTHLPHENIDGIEQQQLIFSSDGVLPSYEIDCNLLQNMTTIGEGAFGVVAKATLLKQRNGTEKQIVAVKMLKGFLKNCYIDILTNYLNVIL
jgi:hypothetical protein